MNKLLESVPTNEERSLLRNQILSVVSKQNLLDNMDLHVTPENWVTVNMAISDGYIDCVQKGLIGTKKSEIESFTENGVSFTDGTCTDADVIVWCTGYDLQMDFFDESVLKSIEYDSNQSAQPIILYKNTFPRDIDNLAFVGMLRDPTYGFGELQGRWISEVFSNKRKLPIKKQMEEYLIKQQFIRKLNLQQEQNENFVAYMDDIAKEIDALPDFEKIKETDEDLYRILCNGLAAPVHYRLKDKKDLAVKVLNEINEVIASL
jgi:dimethylaniline monooxygenase (N-oxide forming)